MVLDQTPGHFVSQAPASPTVPQASSSPTGGVQVGGSPSGGVTVGEGDQTALRYHVKTRSNFFHSTLDKHRSVQHWLGSGKSAQSGCAARSQMRKFEQKRKTFQNKDTFSFQPPTSVTTLLSESRFSGLFRQAETSLKLSSSASIFFCQGLPSVSLLAPLFARGGTGDLLGSGPTGLRLRNRKHLHKDMCARWERGWHGKSSVILTPSRTTA